jgi:hypothetical protein
MGGGGTVMAAIGNTSRTAVARSPTWMRCVLAWAWTEESEGGTEESVAPRPTPFEAEAGETGERWGSWVQRRAEERMGQREGGGVPVGGGQRGVAMPRGRPNRGGEMGMTGGPWP